MSIIYRENNWSYHYINNYKRLNLTYYFISLRLYKFFLRLG